MLPNKQKTPDAAKAVIGQFPASVMTLALLAGYSQPRETHTDAINSSFCCHKNRLSAILKSRRHSAKIIGKQIEEKSSKN